MKPFSICAAILVVLFYSSGGSASHKGAIEEVISGIDRVKSLPGIKDDQEFQMKASQFIILLNSKKEAVVQKATATGVPESPDEEYAKLKANKFPEWLKMLADWQLGHHSLKNKAFSLVAIPSQNKPLGDILRRVRACEGIDGSLPIGCTKEHVKTIRDNLNKKDIIEFKVDNVNKMMTIQKRYNIDKKIIKSNDNISKTLARYLSNLYNNAADDKLNQIEAELAKLTKK